MKLRPLVKFKFITNKTGRDFQDEFRNILADFFEAISQNKTNKQKATCLRKGYDHLRFGGDESGVGCFCVGDRFISHCKAHFYDRVSVPEFGRQTEENDYCGVVFRNHADPPRLAEEVFLLADAFEKFLRERGIHFKRYNFSNDSGYFPVQ